MGFPPVRFYRNLREGEPLPYDIPIYILQNQKGRCGHRPLRKSHPFLRVAFVVLLVSIVIKISLNEDYGCSLISRAACQVTQGAD